MRTLLALLLLAPLAALTAADAPKAAKQAPKKQDRPQPPTRAFDAPGELRHTPGHVVDVVPTVLELAGVTKPTDWKGQAIPAAPGKSLVAALKDDVTIERPSLWWLHEENKAIRVGDFKLVAAKGDAWALYDLSTDRAEQFDLSAKMPEKAKELADLWQKQTDETVALAKLTLSEQPKGKAKKKAH
jgi:arylsulfatase A-like enzyme